MSYDDARLKELIFSKLVLVVANLCKCDFLFPEEIRTTKNIYELLDIGFPSKFNTFLNVTTPLDLQVIGLWT